MTKVTRINSSDLIGAREIYESDYPLTKTQLFSKIKKGEFPEPMKVFKQFCWLRVDIVEFFGRVGKPQKGGV